MNGLMREKMKIRIATCEDVNQITALIIPFIDEFAVDNNGRQLFSAEIIQRLVENSEVNYFVYENNHKIIGVIAYKKPAHLVHFFISKAYQGQGIGRTMWNFILDKVQQTEALVFTVNSSCNAQMVYEKFGFIVQGQTIENHGLRYVPMSFDLGSKSLS